MLAVLLTSLTFIETAGLIGMFETEVQFVQQHCMVYLTTRGRFTLLEALTAQVCRFGGMLLVLLSIPGRLPFREEEEALDQAGLGGDFAPSCDNIEGGRVWITPVFSILFGPTQVGVYFYL